MKKIISLILMLLLFVQTAAALVMDGNSPFYGDYLFVYNPTSETQMLSPSVDLLSSANEEEAVLLSEQQEDAMSTVHPSFFQMERPANLEATEELVTTGVAMRNTAELAIGAIITPYVAEDIRYTPYTFVKKELQYLATSEFCDVFVELDEDGTSVISETAAQALADEYDSVCNFMIPNFGDYISMIDWQKLNGVYTGSVQYARNGNSKISIYIYDIQDGFNGSGGYTLGYFWSGDLYPQEWNGSGNCEAILHLDTYPTMGLTKETFDITELYSTAVHETQHLISFTDYFLSNTQEDLNEIWWNEAFSMAAEHMYTGKPIAYRINSYNQSNNSVALRKGLVLNYTDYAQNGNNTASNYSTSYLFGQYLRTQTKALSGGGNRIFKTVLSQPYGDYRAILKGLAAIGYPYLPSDFPTLYRNFRMATILKYPTGPYGFAGESAFNGLKDNAYTGTATVTLKPRAGIVLKTPKNFVPPEDSKLKYIAFSHRGIYTYELNPADGYTVNITHGYLPQCGATLWVAGYNAEGQLIGVDDISIATDTENYTYTLPAETVTKKFFLWAADDNQKPLAVSVEE